MPDETYETTDNVNSAQAEQSQSGYVYDADSNSIVFPNGNKLPIEEAAKGYMRQQDYTGKTQELAQMRKMLGTWATFVENLRKHPKGKEIEEDFRNYWKTVEQRYLNGNQQQPESEEEAEDDEPTEQEMAISRLELDNELRQYEDSLGRRLSSAEQELTFLLMATNPNLSIKQAHSAILQRVQDISKGMQEQKRKATAPSGGANIFGTVSTKKSPREMTSKEREALLERIIKEGMS